MPQPLWNIESLENRSQIVPKRHRSSESCPTENTSRDKDRASVSKVRVLIQLIDSNESAGLRRLALGLLALIEKAIPHWLKFRIEASYPSLLE